ncbi:hypothetical protein [Paenarthrobacter sp. C1]|uniref:hypothetical protein n=1 Tax=Paenarthrobacter sp. C1 TaxID=3400220 RepID=UPI003BF51872
MNENAGVIRLDTLMQSDHCVDRHGNQHALTDMTQGYLQNVLGYLRDGAVRLYEMEIQRHENQMFLAELKGWDPERPEPPLPQGTAAAQAWMEGTSIVTAIRTLLGETSQ